MKKHSLSAAVIIAFAAFSAPVMSFAPAPQDQLGFSVSFSKTNPVVGDTVEIIFKARVPVGFHVYSEKSDCPEDDGPMRAEWIFDPADGIEYIGSVTGIGDHMAHDDVFHCSTGEFDGQCEFRQTIRITGPVHNLSAHFTGQKCSIKDGTCYLVKEDVPIMLHIH